MKRALTGVMAAVIVLGGFVGAATAGSRNIDPIYANPIYRATFWDFGTGWRQFETTDLKGGIGYEDTFMVITRPDGTEFYNDNCGSQKRSCYWVNHSS